MTDKQTDDSFWQGGPGERMGFAPQAVALGLEYVSSEKNVGVMKAPWREDLVGDPETGVIAGGVVTSLLDHVCGLAVQMSGDGVPTPTATLDLRIDYMRPAHPRRDVYARAHCYKRTRSIAFLRATAYEDDPDDPVATAQAAFAITTFGGIVGGGGGG
jgi:uncharacterized protein (TIGR00369 family)